MGSSPKPIKDRIAVGTVDLDRHAVRPRPERPLPADRDARVEQKRAASAGSGLRELLGELKKDAHLRNIPVVVLTTSDAEKGVLAAYELHANAYIVVAIIPWMAVLDLL